MIAGHGDPRSCGPPANRPPRAGRGRGADRGSPCPAIIHDRGRRASLRGPDPVTRLPMDILHDALGFAARGFIVFATIALTVLFCVAVLRRRRPRGSWLHVKPLNKQIEALGDALRGNLMKRRELRKLRRKRKKVEAGRPNVFVLDFKGDLFATAVRNLREEVTAITAVAGKGDEVVVRLESAGGAGPHYGLAAAQVMRGRDKSIKLTVCIDRVAGSAGYKQARGAAPVVGAPFATIRPAGSAVRGPTLHP